ncbi:hypothetical protein BGW42_006204 [Actinomortierella wolfii]|nr:hypothetical protein BGW42_006204 [Actinomortierella wolfii]
MKRPRGTWDEAHHSDAPLPPQAEVDQESGAMVAHHQNHRHHFLQEEQQQQQRQAHTLSEDDYVTPGSIGIEGRVLKKLKRITLSSNPPLQSSPESENGEHTSAPWQEASQYSEYEVTRQHQQTLYQQHQHQQTSLASPSSHTSAAALFGQGPIKISTRTQITLQPPIIHVPDVDTHRREQQQAAVNRDRHGDKNDDAFGNISNSSNISTSSSEPLRPASSSDTEGFTGSQCGALYSQMNSILQEVHASRFGLPLDSPNMGPLYALHDQRRLHPYHEQQQQQQQQSDVSISLDEDDDMVDVEAFSTLPPTLHQHQQQPGVSAVENREYDDINAQLRAAFLARHGDTHL